jgi:uncharacterized RDD family membrane protein YckC
MATCPTCGTEEVAGQRVCGSCGSPTSVYANPAPLAHYPDSLEAPSDVRLAGFWTRFLSYAIDYLLLLIVVPLPLSAANANFATSLGIVTLIAFLYGSLFIGLGHGQTIGMKVVSIRCVDEDGVTELGYPRAAKRALAYGALLLLGSIYHFHRYTHPTTLELHREDHHVLIFLAFYLPHLVDLLWVSWDKRNQTLHDKFAHSIVIRTK